jgi:hypothetical protein
MPIWSKSLAAHCTGGAEMADDALQAPVLSGSLDLLARAALSPLPRALQAWSTWRSQFDLDATSWAEVRLLGAIAPRIAELEPGADIAARLTGIQKFLWVNSSACLAAAAPAVRTLHNEAIPGLLMKGSARVAENPGALAERLIRDVDVLVPFEMAQRAAELLMADGWELTGWQLGPYHDAPFAAHHAWAFTRGKGEIDLHHFSNTLNRLAGDDDALWHRSRTIQWQGVPLKVPAASDALLIALIHGVRFSEGGNADWVVDAARLLSSSAIDWGSFLSEVAARRLFAVVLPGLGYLTDVLGTPLPDGLLSALRSRISPAMLDELAVYRATNWPRTAEEDVAVARGAVERVLASAAPRPSTDFQPTEVKRNVLAPGGHEVTISVPPTVTESQLCALRVIITAPRILAQSRAEILFFAPGLPLGREAALANAAGQVRSELLLPAALLRLRRIDHLRLEIYLPGYISKGEAWIDITWLVQM